jgi:quinol monooxygenase YgiN
MSVVVVAIAFPVPERRAEVIAAFEAAIARVHGEPGVELYALHEGRDRLVMIEKYESEQARSEHLKGATLASQPAVCPGGQAQQRSRRAGPRAAPGRKRPEGHAVTAGR